MRRMNEKGFTLVELMVVLAILGLLAGIGVPQYLKTLENSRIAADKASLASVQSAIDAWLAETGAPITDGELTVDRLSEIKAKSLLSDSDVTLGEIWGTHDLPIISKADSTKKLYIQGHKAVYKCAE